MAEIFAYAVLTLFPDAKLIGSEVLDYGFSYDFILPYPEFPLEMIEDRLLHIRMENKSIDSKVMMPLNAASLFDHKKQEHLANLARSDSSSLLSVMQIDNAYFLCSEPHLKSTRDLLYFKILKMENTSGISRIEVAAFESKDELKKFLKNYETASKRDSKILGKELGLFIEEGFLERGALLRRILINAVEKKYLSLGFKEIYTSKDLVKFLEKIEYSKVYTILSDEVIAFSSCLLSEVKQEILSVLQIIEENIKLLGLEYKVAVFVPKKSVIKPDWLKDILNVEVSFSDVFRVEFSFKDALGRFWKAAYFEVKEFLDRAQIKFSALGSLERLISLLIEHYAGEFPLRFAPEQVGILPVGFSAKEKAIAMKKNLEGLGVRVFVDEADMSLKNKIHSAQARKIPYLCVIGDKEVQTNSLSIRTRSSHKLIEMSQEEFVAHILKKLEENFESQ